MNKEAYIDGTTEFNPLDRPGSKLFTVPKVAGGGRSTSYYKDLEYVIKNPKFTFRGNHHETGNGKLLHFVNEGSQQVSLQGVEFLAEIYAAFGYEQEFRLNFIVKWEGIVDGLRIE